MLPTHLSVSTLSANSVYGSLAGCIASYAALLVVEVWLLQRFARQGLARLRTGRYPGEAVQQAAAGPGRTPA